MEIYKDNKKVKNLKVKNTELKMIDVDFSSLKSLSGNKLTLDYLFQTIKFGLRKD